MVKAMREDIKQALQTQRSAFFMDSDDDFKVVSVQAFLDFLKKYKDDDKIEKVAAKVASEFAARANEQNKLEVADNLKRQTGVDVSSFVYESNKVSDRLKGLTLANAQLIKSIPTQYLDKVQTTVTRALASGTSTKDIVREIENIGNVTTSRAKLIARDQASKANSALTRARHEDLGITKYRWSTSGDERVRDTHAANDGKVFSYADPPPTGNPGDEVNCRCVAIAVFDNSTMVESENTRNDETDNISSLADLFTAAISNKSGNKQFLNLGTVNLRTIAAAKASLGLDISGWEHSIDESSIRHILKHHGNSKVESSRGQRAVTKADIEALPTVLTDFDSIEYAGVNDSGHESFLVKKVIDGEVYCVQELRKGRKKLSVKTMWIRKEKP